MLEQTEVIIEKYRDAGIVKGRAGIRYRGMDYDVILEDYGTTDPRARTYPEVRDDAIKTYRGISEVLKRNNPQLRAIPLVQRDRIVIQGLQAIGKIA